MNTSRVAVVTRGARGIGRLQVVPMALMILLVHTIDYSRCYARWRRGRSDTAHGTAQIHTTIDPAR
jgi:hypothetical protein